MLTAAAERAGLDRAAAAEVLASGRYAEAVRAEQALWRGRGISAVPAVVVEGKWLISGGQPAGVYEALRRIAGKPDLTVVRPALDRKQPPETSLCDTCQSLVDHPA